MYPWYRKNWLNSGSHLPPDCLEDSLALRDRAFSHNLAYISGGNDRIFMKILSQMYRWTRKSPLYFGGNSDPESESRPYSHWRRYAVSVFYMSLALARAPSIISCYTIRRISHLLFSQNFQSLQRVSLWCIKISQYCSTRLRRRLIDCGWFGPSFAVFKPVFGPILIGLSVWRGPPPMNVPTSHRVQVPIAMP